MAFVHLHTHSEYSLLDGANRIPELVAHVKKLGMDSLAVTDHGNMHAAWSFYERPGPRRSARSSASRPTSRSGPAQAREKPAGAPAAYSHLVLLAKNRAGYKNLVRLTSIGFTEGFYRRPRIDKECLEQHSEGIVCLAACLSGEVALHLRQGRYDEAKRSAEWFASVFGPDGFWLEVQQHGIAEERLVTEGMLRLGQELGLGVVATNDAHYLRREDAESHDVLLAIGTGSDLDDPKRFRFTGEESYVKSEKEMRALFPDHPEVAGQHADRRRTCASSTSRSAISCPAFPAPPGTRRDEALLERPRAAGRRAALRHAARRPQVARAARLRARRHQHRGLRRATSSSSRTSSPPRASAASRWGPGRGSAAGSIVAYALGITNVCPLRFDLLFERFLNPERVSMPDIDVDFCFERRGEVIEYVRQRYGRASVGQIVTFGTMKARAAVKDVARVLRIPPRRGRPHHQADPSGPAYSLTIAEAVREGGRDEGPGARQPRLPAPASQLELAHRGHLAPHVGARRRRGDRAGPARRSTCRSARRPPRAPAPRPTAKSPSSPSTRWARSRRSACSRWTCSASRRSP